MKGQGAKNGSRNEGVFSAALGAAAPHAPLRFSAGGRWATPAASALGGARAGLRFCGLTVHRLHAGASLAGSRGPLGHLLGSTLAAAGKRARTPAPQVPGNGQPMAPGSRRWPADGPRFPAMSRRWPAGGQPMASGGQCGAGNGQRVASGCQPCPVGLVNNCYSCPLHVSRAGEQLRGCSSG